MGNLTYRGLVPPDDPMINGRVELFRKTDAQSTEHDVAEHIRPGQTLKPHREFTVDWHGDQLSLQLDKAGWKRISSGKAVTDEVYEEYFHMYIHWHFNSDPEHNLILDHGGPSSTKCSGNIECDVSAK